MTTEFSEARTRSDAGDDRLTAGRFAVVLGTMIFVAFPQVLIGWETFVVRDFGLFAYPLAHFQRECFWSGELPFWNPYNNCGVPFLAQWNTMPLYPPALIYLLLPLSWSLGVFCLLHLWFAGLGMYFLAHRWTGNRLAAAVAGVVFAFNGLSLNLLMWPSHIATLSWMPWVFLTVEQAWRRGGRNVILAALAGAMQMLAGGPETILFTWLLLLAFWTLHLLETRPSSSVRGHPFPGIGPALWRLALVVLLVAGLAAAQLLPFLDLAAHSQRERGFADTTGSLPGRGWVNFLVPMAFGSTWNRDLFFQYGQYWTSSYYLGVGAMLLIFLAVWTVRQRRVWWLAGAAGAAFLFALGDQTFVYRGLRSLIPQLSLMTYPVKFVTVIVFAAPLLAAFAVARLRSRSEPDRKMEKRLLSLAGMLVVVIAAILFWAWRFPLPLDDFPVTLRNGLGRIAFLAATVMVLLLLQRPDAGAGWQRILSLALLVIIWQDVWTHEPDQNPTVPTAVYHPGIVRTELALNPEPALGGTRVMVSPWADVRFDKTRTRNVKDAYLAKRLGYFSNCNLLDDTPKVNGFFSLYPRECDRLVTFLYTFTNVSFPSLLDFLSVSHVTAPGEFSEWQPRPTCLPMVTAGQQPVFLDDTNALVRMLRPDFDAAKVVCLPVEAQRLVSISNQTSARVVSRQFSRQRVEINVDAAEPSLVVVSQTYYHWWRAEVDGQPATLWRANYAFQAVAVPAGTHRVRLVYEDRSFRFGAAISGLTLLGCLAATLYPRRKAE